MPSTPLYIAYPTFSNGITLTGSPLAGREVPGCWLPRPTAPAQTDDTELIAVIAAAIAASTGTSTSDFVVRSINRR